MLLQPIGPSSTATDATAYPVGGAAETLRMLGVFVLEFEHLGSGPRP